MSIESTGRSRDPGFTGKKLGYSIAEAVAASGLSRSMIYLLIRDGKLIARKCRNRTIITGPELAECLANLPVAGGETG